MNSLRIWWERLFSCRFYLLLVALLLMLILPGFFSEEVNEQIIWPANRTILLIACLNMIRKLPRGLILMAVLGLLATGSDWLSTLALNSNNVGLGSILLFGVFITIVTFEGYNQVLKARQVDLHIIVGAFDGFMLIGIVGALIYTFIHIVYPQSFSGVPAGIAGINDLVYFSYITILTIGYGDIVPLTEASRRISIFLGLVGQFYMVVIMAVLVGKYLFKNHNEK